MDAVSVEDWTESATHDWDRLARSVQAPPFLRPGWVAPLCTHLLPSRQSALLCIRRSGRLVGVLPVIARRGGLSTAATWQTPFAGPVCADQDALRLLVAAALDASPRRARMAFVDGGGMPAVEVQNAASCAGRPLLRRTLRRSPYSDVSAGWTEYQRRFSGTRLKQLRRQWRRLAEQGQLVFEVDDGRQDLDRVMEEVLQLEAAGWKGAASSAMLHRPAERQFFMATAAWAAAEGLLRVSFLRLDGAPVAFDVEIEQDATLYCLKTSYDPRFAAYSPGTLTDLRIAERACAQPHVKTIELLGDDEPYKMRLADGVREVVELTVFRAGTGGTLERAGWKNATSGRAWIKDSLPPHRWQQLSALKAVATGRARPAEKPTEVSARSS